MHTLSALSSFLAFSSFVLPSLAQGTAVTPYLTKVFTVVVTLGSPLGPVPLPGGIQELEPITGGNITGSALNATISAGGSADITVLNNGTLATPFIQLWGKTDDGEALFVQANGIGKVGSQFATVKIVIGGKYAYLSDEFILASFTDSNDNPPTSSTIDGWIVTRS